MRNYHEIRSILGARNFFPNVDTVAYFDPQSQTIHLNKIKKNDYVAALVGEDIFLLKNHLSTIYHEVTHWADTIGTVWGRAYIKALYDCYQVMPFINQQGAESEFHKFIDLHDRERRMMRSRYFQTVDPNPPAHDSRNPWMIQFSAGREFDSNGRPNLHRPILFIKFFSDISGRQVARQPLSAGSLLEVNAVWSEICSNFQAMEAMDEDQRIVEIGIYGSQILKTLYTPELTIYTAPAHLLAYYSKVKDVVEVYRTASALAHLVLNFGPEHCAALTPPKDMLAWQELFEGFKNTCDLGFAYMVVASNVDEWQAGLDLTEWLDKALLKSGLPNSREIYDHAEAMMTTEIASGGTDEVSRAKEYLLSLGLKLFRARREGEVALTLSNATKHKLPIVPAFDEDGELISIGAAPFDFSEFSPERMFTRSSELVTWQRRFFDACR